MSLSYALRESVSGFTRTKLSSAISIITICISLCLLGVFAVLSVNTARFMEALRSTVELEAFLAEPLTAADIDTLGAAIAEVEGVESVTFISKQEAARIFREEWGEDITTLLDFNPLPPSFRIALRPGYKNLRGTQAVTDRVQAMAAVDSVVYRKALVEIIDRRTDQINTVTLGLGVLISLSAVLLVSNTIRLAIYAKRRLIRTMELVGATGGFIRLPFLLEGFLQGVIGGVLASSILYLLLEQLLPSLSSEVAGFLQMPPPFFLLVIAGGTALGLIGSVISVVRFIRRASLA